MLLVRISHFVVGAASAGAGGFLAWTQRARFHSIFPPDPAASPWLLIVGVAALAAGVVFLVSAAAPRPKRAARLAMQAARRQEILAAADAFYAERARAADRDWRSGDLPSPPEPVQPTPPEAGPSEAREPDAREPESRQEPLAEVLHAAPEPEPEPELLLDTRMQIVELEPIPEHAQEAPARPAVLKPVATSVPPGRVEIPFRSSATLTPIPRAVEPPPPILAPQPSVQAAPSTASAGEPDPFADIRSAIAEGRLADADRLLNLHRESAQGAALAELTGLAGDQAAAAGRTSNAKWLWRLALKRFGEINAMESPAARAVSERLRLADN